MEKKGGGIGSTLGIPPSRTEARVSTTTSSSPSSSSSSSSSLTSKGVSMFSNSVSEGLPLLTTQVKNTRGGGYKNFGALDRRRENHQLPQPWRCCGATCGLNAIYASFFLVILCMVTSVERVSFKMLVDRVVPFRYLVVVLVVAIEAAMLGVIVQLQANFCDGNRNTHNDVAYTTPFPRRKLLVMAALDLCKDLMMTLPAAAVAPTLTVMLLQGQIPCSMLLAHLWERYRNRKDRVQDSPSSVGSMSSSNPSPQITPPPSSRSEVVQNAEFIMGSNTRDQLGFRKSHYMGATLIALSLVVAFIPVAVEWFAGSLSVGGSTLVYLLSCIPASASVLYKERALMAYRQPIDPYVLNLNVDIYQLIMLVPLAPIIFRVQSMGFFGAYDDDGNYSTGGSEINFSTSLSAGLTCFFFSDTITKDDDVDDSRKDQISPSTERAYCGIALPLLGLYVASILVVNMAVGRVLKYGSGPLLYRSVTAATLTAYVVLGFVAHGVPALAGNGVLSGISMAMLNLPSAFLLVIGNEVYHRFSEPNTEILTEWVSPS